MKVNACEAGNAARRRVSQAMWLLAAMALYGVGMYTIGWDDAALGAGLACSVIVLSRWLCLEFRAWSKVECDGQEA